jgi:RNA polymerase sigma-70 factor (ECF subfamily)
MRELDPDQLASQADRLYRAALALCGSREDAEDLVQETYARVLRRRRLLRHDDDAGYLLTVLRNTFLSARRDAGRRPRTTPLPDGLAVVERRPEGQPEAALAAREVYAAIARLPEILRTAIAFVDLAGLSYAQAARALKINEAALTSRLYRARRELARSLAV